MLQVCLVHNFFASGARNDISEHTNYLFSHSLIIIVIGR
jgi:hypothetical protein